MLLLSIDWDYVTGDCSAFLGAACCGWCKRPPNPLKKRARGNPDGAWRERLAQVMSFPIKVEARVYVTECHAELAAIATRNKATVIYDWDYHLDTEDQPLCCASWIRYVSAEVKHLEVPTEPASIVFLCRSAPWTPAKFDARFYRLVHTIAKTAETVPKFVGHCKRELQENYSRRLRGLSTVRSVEEEYNACISSNHA